MTPSSVSMLSFAPRASRRSLVVGLLACAFAGAAVAADDVTTYKLTARDGRFDPAVLEVAAGKPFKLDVVNEGRKPIEFESKPLKQEKVIAAGKKATLAVGALAPGEYKFFDEFNEATGQGRIVAK